MSPLAIGSLYGISTLVVMFSGIPNFAITFGYTNASWTLKADLVSEFVCRLLNYMDANGFDNVVPEHPGASVNELPFMDFTPGYFQRSMHLLPSEMLFRTLLL